MPFPLSPGWKDKVVAMHYAWRTVQSFPFFVAARVSFIQYKEKFTRPPKLRTPARHR